LLKLIETRLGQLESLGGWVAFGSPASELLARVAVRVAALFGFLFPLIATAFDVR
jgi:hypothetical protein